MKLLRAIALIALCGASVGAQAQVGMGLRVGTLGYGADVDIRIVEKLNVRVGYSAFSLNREIDDTDVIYDGELNLRNFSATIDWHPFASGFRLSLGAIGPGLEVDVVGKPSGNFGFGAGYVIGDGFYGQSEVRSLTGELKMGSSASPYIGLGWGNVVGKKHRVTFLFDFGAIYAGTPEVTLNAMPNCAGLTPAQCNSLTTRLSNDVAIETTELQEDVAVAKWWPVLSLGLGVRFK